MTIKQQPTSEKETMEPHNEYQLQESILSFLKENPGSHTVDDVHFGISDYFADHCYKNEVARILWKLYEEGVIKYAGGFVFFLTTCHSTSMTDKHPITPPPELLYQWRKEWVYHTHTHTPATLDEGRYIATQAARWGADQELAACCEWLDAQSLHLDGGYLRTDRRPKPPSLKEQALESLHHLEAGCEPNIDLLRRALEAPPEGAQ